MIIEYFGHSSFRLTSAAGESIVTDPFGEVGFSMPSVQADVVTISHDHYDHNNYKAVRSDIILNKKGKYSFHGVKIEAIECFHDEVEGKKRGPNLIFLFVIDGLIVCHMGDIGEPCHSALLQKIGKVDVLLLPVGGHYTIDFQEAIEYVEKLHPHIVIPMHYKTSDLSVDIASADHFLEHFQAVERVGNFFTLDKESLGGKTKIIFMERLQCQRTKEQKL